MNDEHIKELVDRANSTAFLLGEITARLSILVEEAQKIIYGDKFPAALNKLLQDIMNRIDSIYYNKKEVENE